MVFIRTNPFRGTAPQYSNSGSRKLITPTQDSRAIAQQALSLLWSIYRSGYDYAKAGVMLSELAGEVGRQDDLFESSVVSGVESKKAARVMAVMDEINQKTRSTVYMARDAGPAAYKMRREHLSPAYTTDWIQLPIVR